MKVLWIVIAALFAVSCTLSYAKRPSRDGVQWTKVGTVANVTVNYTPVMSYGANSICVYSNSNGVTDGSLFRRCGTWASLGPAQLVFSTPAGSSDAYIRTLGVGKGASGTLYAVLYVGPCYGCTGGFSPAWATSTDDGLTWTYFGRFSPFGINQSSAAAIVVDESRTDDYRFMVWMDIGSALYLVHSADSAQWTSDGLNQWPIVGEQPQLCSAAKTQYGVHMICAINPITSNVVLRHVFSCTGQKPWTVLEMASDVVNTATTARKGTNLVTADGLIHALTSSVHWTLPIQAFSC